MKFFYVGFIVLIFAAAVSAFSLQDLIDKIKKRFTTDQLDEIRSKLRDRKINITEALNQAKGRWLEMNDTLFDVATQELKVNLKNETDKSLKKLKFRKNLEIAQNLTQKNTNATFGITPFSFMDFDEFKNNYLMKPIPVEYLPVNNVTKFGSSRRKRATTSNDLRTKNAVNAIRNQGNCGSCWSFATTSTMETSYFKKYSKLYDLAEQQFVNCDTFDSGCNGGWMSNAYIYAENNGIAFESTNAYKAVKGTCTTPKGTLLKVSSYTQLAATDVTSIMNAIDSGYSVAIAMKSGTTAFMSYTGGILTNKNDCTTTSVDHAVVIVGYGVSNNVPYWIVRNSWGTRWGEQGYVRIQRGINYCNMETYPFFPIMI